MSYHALPATPIVERYTDAGSNVVEKETDRKFLTEYKDDVHALPSSKSFTIEELDEMYYDDIPTSTSRDRNRWWWLIYFRTIQFLRATFICVIPSFISSLWVKGEKPPARKVPPTAYLNGVRGLAAFFVFTQHFVTDYYAGERHWGHQTKNEGWPLRLPVLALTVDGGGFMVTTFYVLSGYVLAYKPLEFVRQQNESALIKNMTSAIFRRALRLFLPLLPPLLLAGVFVWMGIYGDWKHMRPVRSVDGSLWSELLLTLRVFEGLANPFPTNSFHPLTIPSLYTIPVEFRGSILVFTMVIGTARLTPMLRMSILAIIALVAMSHNKWDSFCFMNGMILAEFRYIRNESTLGIKAFTNNRYILQVWKISRVFFWISALALSLYLGSFPNGRRTGPGYQTISTWAPSVFNQHGMFLWDSIASVMLLYTLENLECLQRPFKTTFMLYMGDISFSLYIVHFPVLFTMGRWIMRKLIQATGSSPWAPLLDLIIITPAVIWGADLQWRTCDMTAVKFAKWLEGILFI